MTRRPVAPLLLLAAAMLPASPASASALPRITATSATLDGARLTVTWAPPAKAGRRVELQVATKRPRTAKGKRVPDRVVTVRKPAAKGRTTLTLKGVPKTLAPSAVSLRLRVCSGTGRALHCGSWSKRRHPVVAGAGGGPSVSTGTSVAPPATAAGAGPTIGTCPQLPTANAFNQDVSTLPVDPHSDAYVRSIGAGSYAHPDFGRDVGDGSGPIGFGIPYRVVPATQPLVPTVFTDYADESDPGPYPVPLDTPVEGGPGADGDRHVLVVREGECKLYEMGNAYPKVDGWEATGGAVWDLNTGAPRPARWTSADAAGLPILPGLVRYDEVAAGVIRHAIRFTVPRTQKAYIAPASHWASGDTSADLPPMGLRMRLKASYDLSGWHGQGLVVATALKRYGMLLADNGSSWYLSGAPDTRWDDDDLGQLKGIPGSAFEAVQTGPVVTP